MEMKALSDRQNASGFTLIELFGDCDHRNFGVHQPSGVLSQAAKAKQTEAKGYVGAVTRAQQAYRIEKSTFAGEWSDLEIGIPAQTQDYTYTLSPASDIETTIAAESEAPELRDYSGGVVVLEDSGQTSTAACQTKKPGGSVILPTLDRSIGAGCEGDDVEIMR
jgi:type IV pilus assembly protein PilA